MRVSNVREERVDGGVRASADVVWETASRPPLTIFIEIEGSVSLEIETSGDAFLAGCLVPALRHGERRIRIEGSVCPKLRDGCTVAAGLLRSWYGGRRGDIEIEAERGFQPRTAARAGAMLFLTGGVDSTFVLRSNHRAFPPGHPGRIRECILISLLFDREAASPDLAREFDSRLRRSAAGVAGEAGVRLLTARTNLRDLDPSFDFFARESHSSVLAAVGHLLSARGSTLHLAASRDVRNLAPSGTDPLLDASFSSSRLEVLHTGLGFTRLDKVGEISEWKAGLRHLMVCQSGPLEGPYLNCGTCEKCKRTLAALHVFGAVADAASFRTRDLSPSGLLRGRIDPENFFHWKYLQQGLRSRGAGALARVVGLKLLVSRFLPHRRILDPAEYGRREASPGTPG